MTCGSIRIVVSTVGLFRPDPRVQKIETIGWNRYFETMAFHAKHDGRYWDMDVEREVPFAAPWAIAEQDADDRANDMHDTVVAELTQRLRAGECFETPCAGEDDA